MSFRRPSAARAGACCSSTATATRHCGSIGSGGRASTSARCRMTAHLVRRLAILLATTAALSALRSASAQSGEGPRIFADAPEAHWIAPPGMPADSFGVFHARRAIDLAVRPTRFVVHVSADNRYRLYVNGVQVSSGPQRSDATHWRYETIDLAPHL